MGQMETVVVERLFDEPTVFEALQAAEDVVAWCLEQHRVTFVRSYLSLDARSMICIYSAPDADAVRETQHRGRLPIARVWSARILAATGRHQASPGFSTVIVERDLPEGMSIEQIQALLAKGAACLETNQVELLESKLSTDSRRMVCVFQALDAEAVRRANRQMGVPVSRAWTASVRSR